MFEPKVALTWDDTNNIETGYKIYRSNSPMDIEDMPLELVVLDKDQSNYIDYDVIDGNQYYYRIGAFTPVDEEFSEEVVVTATGTSEHIIYTQGDITEFIILLIHH